MLLNKLVCKRYKVTNTSLLLSYFSKDPNPIIDGRKANVNLAYLGAKPRNNVQLTGTSFFLLRLTPTVCSSLSFVGLWFARTSDAVASNIQFVVVFLV